MSKQEPKSSVKLTASNIPTGMREEYPLLDGMVKRGHPLTRETYLDLAYWGQPQNPLSAEEEMLLPPIFRGQEYQEE